MDPENGISTTEQSSPTTEVSAAPESQTAPESSGRPSGDTPVVLTDERAPVSAALEAFNRELGRPNTASQTTTQQAAAQKPPESQDASQTQTPTETVVQSAQAPLPQRKFDGLDEAEVPYFKHMSNSAYAYLYPKWLESKRITAELQQKSEELKKIQGTHFYDHENAYELDPQYKGLSEQALRMEAEAKYWEEQLAALEADQPITPVQYDPQSKGYQYGQPFTPGTPVEKARLRAQIIAGISNAQLMQQQARLELGNFQNNFKSQHQSYRESLNKIKSEALSRVDPTLLPVLTKAAASKMEKFPARMRGQPEVELLASLWVINDGLVKAYQELKGKLAGNNIVNRTAQVAGPATVGGGAIEGKKETVGSITEQFHSAGFRH